MYTEYTIWLIHRDTTSLKPPSEQAGVGGYYPSLLP